MEALDAADAAAPPPESSSSGLSSEVAGIGSLGSGSSRTEGGTYGFSLDGSRQLSTSRPISGVDGRRAVEYEGGVEYAGYAPSTSSSGAGAHDTSVVYDTSLVHDTSLAYAAAAAAANNSAPPSSSATYEDDTGGGVSLGGGGGGGLPLGGYDSAAWGYGTSTGWGVDTRSTTPVAPAPPPGIASIPEGDEHDPDWTTRTPEPGPGGSRSQPDSFRDLGLGSDGASAASGSPQDDVAGLLTPPSAGGSSSPGDDPYSLQPQRDATSSHWAAGPVQAPHWPSDASSAPHSQSAVTGVEYAPSRDRCDLGHKVSSLHLEP